MKKFRIANPFTTELTYDELKGYAVLGWTLALITSVIQLTLQRQLTWWVVAVGSVFMIATCAKATFIPKLPRRRG